MDKVEIIVQKKLKDLKLVPILELPDFIKKKKRFFAGPVLTDKKKKVFFKILIVDDITAAESIKKEIKIRDFLIKFQNKIFFPHLIKYDDKNIPYWFISQYREGPILGYFYELYDKNDENISLIVDFLCELHKIPYNILASTLENKEFFFWKNDFQDHLNLVKSYENGIEKEIIKEINFFQIYQFIENKKIYFQKSPLVFSHGDFTLANMVISEGKLFLTDWEHAHLDNFVHDIAHLWIQLWRYPTWRKKLLLEFINRLSKDRIEEFKNLFQAVIITEALGELRWSFNICPVKYKNDVKKINLKTIKVALKGFNNLLEDLYL